VFDALFYFQNIGGYFLDGHSQLVDRKRPFARSRTPYPLRLDVYPTVAEIGNQIFAGYEGSVFSDQAIDRLLNAYGQVLSRMASDPQAKAGAVLDGLREDERRGRFAFSIDVFADDWIW
jgi:hypothetical protein